MSNTDAGFSSQIAGISSHLMRDLLTKRMADDPEWVTRNAIVFMRNGAREGNVWTAASYLPRLLVEILLPWLKESSNGDRLAGIEGWTELQVWLEHVEAEPAYKTITKMETLRRAAFVEMIAAACHQQNLAYCAQIGDTSQVPWQEAADWQRVSAIEGVENALKGTTPQKSHENWCEGKVRDGWVYGPVKDAEAKTHHCLVPYEDLPEAQKRKDHLFLAMVDQLGRIAGLIVPN